MTAARPESGLKAALKYTGIPLSWLSKRPKLPSRNWLILIGVTSSITGSYIYDRRQCKAIRQEYVDRVAHLAQEPLNTRDSVRKVKVYGAKWPDDDDADRSLKYFRKYVKPILVAAAVDYEVINGKRLGNITNRVADEIKARRRIDAGIDKPKVNPILLVGDHSPESVRQRELAGGIVVVGRPTFKEYMEGLKRGWTEGLEIVDKEEALAHELESDGRFDEPHEFTPEDDNPIDGEPEPTKSRLPPSMPINTSPFMPQISLSSPSRTAPNSSEIDASQHIPPSSIPPYPPILFVPFTNYLGFIQIPLMIWDFFNQRQKVRSGAECAHKLIMGNSRPFDKSTDLDLGVNSEYYYKSSMASYPEAVEKLRQKFYKELPKQLETTRAINRGTREPTKDEINNPPPSEVELRMERLTKELRWRSDVAGWNIIKPEQPVAYDDRFGNALRVFY